MLSNSLINSVTCTMSNRNSPSPPRKKILKHSPVSSQNSNNRLKKVASTASYVGEPEEGPPDGPKPDSLPRSKASTNSSKSGITRKSNDVINEHETSNTTFNGKKTWTNVTKPQSYPSSDPQASVSNKIEKESELVGILSKQLFLAESQMQRMQAIMAKADERLKSKDQEIGRFKRKIKDLEVKSKNQNLNHKKELQKQRAQAEDSEYLYRRCLMMEHQIFEMEKFLADYGLVWVGDSSKNPNLPEGMPNDYMKNCYKQLVANIEELNMAVGKGEVHVHHNQGGGGATFKTSSCMNLKFYKNGLVVQNGPIRPYDDLRATSFIRDILDGYFPSELQSAYPHGVPFKVEDHRTETFMGPGGGFPGHGYRLGKPPHGEENSAAVAAHPRAGTASLGSRCSVAQRQNFYSIDPTVPFTSSSPRSFKSKSLSESPSTEMMHLRSQILASHNNNCSDSHIQSHINAELTLAARKEKIPVERKRELATKSTEYHISVRERTLKLRDVRMGRQRLSSGSRTSHHSSTDRSSIGRTPSRIDNMSTDSKSRSRSVSLNGGQFKVRSLSKLRMSSVTASPSKTSNLTSRSAGTKRPRATKSATLERKSAPPVLHQINEPTGKPGELRLKVRSLNGSTVYLVHVSADDTVARLYHLLDSSLGKVRLRGYKIVISGYAPKRLEQLGVSLREYGISRDSVLHLVND